MCRTFSGSSPPFDGVDSASPYIPSRSWERTVPTQSGQKNRRSNVKSFELTLIPSFLFLSATSWFQNMSPLPCSIALLIL